MPIKYLPYFPNTIKGQAVLNNFTRTRRALVYEGDDAVERRIARGLPLYEVEITEVVDGESSGAGSYTSSRPVPALNSQLSTLNSQLSTLKEEH